MGLREWINRWRIDQKCHECGMPRFWHFKFMLCDKTCIRTRCCGWRH
jgi:ribosomal protein S14